MNDNPSVEKQLERMNYLINSLYNSTSKGTQPCLGLLEKEFFPKQKILCPNFGF